MGRVTGDRTMMRICNTSRVLLHLVVCTVAILACHVTNGKSEGPVLKGPYLGQNPPGLRPEVFAQGIVSTDDGHEWCCTFSPDGRELYFNRQMQIMVCKWHASGWTTPRPVQFTEGYRSHEPHITADNRRLLFGSWRPNPDFPEEEKPYGIWMVERRKESWSRARYAGYGMYVTTTEDGAIYLTDIRDSAPSGQGIAKTRLVHGRFAELIRQKGGVVRPAPDRRPGRHPCIFPDERFIIFDSYDKGGKGRLYICYRRNDGTWSRAFDPGDTVNFGDHICASLSPDGEYMFYHANGDIHWVRTDAIVQSISIEKN